MGASSISFGLPKQATATEVDVRFRQIQEEEREENGHRDGYSGDFNTVHRIRCRFDRVFDDIDSAEDYCLDHAEKWAYAVAVHYKNQKGDIWTIVAGWGAE